MAKKIRKVYSDPKLVLNAPIMVFGAGNGQQELFSVSSYTLNNADGIPFPGNIYPEGYFYSPFYEVTLKELSDDTQSSYTKRINFVPTAYTTNVTSGITRSYNPEMEIFEDKTLWTITILSPVFYEFLVGQPFSIYDIQDEITYRGYLNKFSASIEGGTMLEITTEAKISREGLTGRAEGANGMSRYIIALIEENVPSYAEYIPSSGKLVWRAPKKMSDLTADSPIYNMPFANGRLYIHHNVNVFLRRQDPQGEYKLSRPSRHNPLKKYQVDGDAKLDLDYIQYIIDSMVDSC